MANKTGRNDPCPCGSGKKYKNCCGQTDAPLPLIPDRRLMERPLRAISQQTAGREFKSEKEFDAFLREVGPGGRFAWKPETPLERAQELVYQALEASRGSKRIKLAMDALHLSPDCADAYVLLAEEGAETLDQAIDFYQRGMQAGRRGLGEGIFRRDKGHFWGLVETRPYMRAREGLAHCLWVRGDREAAVGHYEEMLRLNPNDNQGARYSLLSALLELGHTDKAAKLLKKYKSEESTTWLFSRALASFVQRGDSAEAREALQTAMAGNRHVVSYLLGRRKVPRDLPDSVSPGDEDEAADYVMGNKKAWAKAAGALDWLRLQVPGIGDESRPSAASRPKRRAVRLPPSAAKLEEAPQTTSRLSLPLPVERAASLKEASPAPIGEASPTRDEWRRLYAAAAAFHQLAPWQWMGDDELFGIEDPETGEVGYCCVMGRLGEHFALGVYPGAQGFDSYRRVAEGTLDPEDIDDALNQRCLMASFEDRAALTAPDLDVIRDLGLRFRGRGAWPQFRSMQPWFVPWYLTGRDCRTLATALERASDITLRVRTGLDLLQGTDKGMVLVARPDASGTAWREDWQALPPPQVLPRPNDAPAEERLKGLRAADSRSDATWEVELSRFPGPVQEQGQRPYFPRLWLCAEASSGFIMGANVLEPWRSPDELQEAFVGILEQAAQVPGRLHVAKPDTRELLEPLARKLGITLAMRRRLPALEKVKKELAKIGRH